MPEPKRDDDETLADIVQNAEIVDLTDVPLDDPRHPEYEPPSEP